MDFVALVVFVGLVLKVLFLVFNSCKVFNDLLLGLGLLSSTLVITILST